MTTFLTAFSVVAFASFLFSVLNTHYAMVDLQILKLKKLANGRRLIAKANLRTHALRSLECLGLFAVAVASITDFPDGNVRRLMNLALLTAVSAMIFVNCVADYRHRNRVLKAVYLRAEEIKGEDVA
jgi:hypothetical protein